MPQSVETFIEPITAAPLQIPPASATCLLSAINTTCSLTVPAATLVEPVIRGHEYMNFPTIAFLITHAPTGRRVMFDLGCKKEFWKLPPPIATSIDEKVPGIRVDKNVSEILEDGGVDLSTLEAAIVSHHHYDHTGDLGTFPKAMKLVVGPGFSHNFLPGYPTAEDSPVFEDELCGRDVEELDFTDAPVVAGYRAFDYFGDGSLWILDTPGHAIGHLCALVSTSKNRSVFLGADICHFGGSFRPTPHLPMPWTIASNELGLRDSAQGVQCSCSLFLGCHPVKDNPRTNTYYKACSKADSWYLEPEKANQSIEKLKVLDASEKVLVLIAHDPGVLGVLPLFPNGVLNGWHNKDWKRLLRWRFLSELPIYNRPQEFLVSGTWKNGQLVKPLIA